MVIKNSFLNKFLKNKTAVYYLLYTITFTIMITAVFSWFFLNNKSFLWRDDGIFQHFNSLVYYREYLLTIIKTLFTTGNLEIPLWDFSLGYGADVITTLNYYVIGDPINLLVVFFPERYMELAYSSIIILRLYLAGITFSLYCSRMKRDRFAAFIGTFVYVFCGYSLFAAVRHPFFIGPMILLPCFLIGIENIFEKKNPKLFILMVFLSAISNFYFFYMLSILIFLYACMRFFFVYQRPWFSTFFKTLLQFIAYYLTGVLMAAILFLPVVIETLSTGRAGVSHGIDLLYPINYYGEFFTRFITVKSIGNWTYMGYASVAIIAVFVLFLTKKKYKEVKISFIILTAFIWIPFAGVVFNGFSYNANRWIWGYSFLIAFILVNVMEEIFLLTRKKIVIITIPILLYSIICAFLNDMGIENNRKQVGFLLLFLVLLIVFTFLREGMGTISKRVVYGMKSIMLFIVLTNIVVNASDLYSPEKGNYIDQFCDAGTGLSILKDGAGISVAEIGDTSFYRYEDNPYNQAAVYNTSLQTGVNSTTFYFSLANGAVYEYLKELQTNYNRDFKYIGLDGRASLGTLACSKYFTIAEGNEAYLPFGYTKMANSTEKDGITYYAYENDYVLPLGYTYGTYIDKVVYEALSPTRKQQALLQGIVLEHEESLLRQTQLEFTDRDIDYEMTLGKGVKLKGNKIITTSNDAAIELTFDGESNCETHCTIQGLTYTAPNPRGVGDKKSREGLAFYERAANRLMNYSRRTRKLAALSFESGDVTKSFTVHTPESIYYAGRSDYTANMGYENLGKSGIKITFKNKGIYTFDDISITCQPMEAYVSNVSALKEDVLENIEISTNAVAGSIILDNDKILCLSIPYSKGWRAYANGEEVELMKVNTMYMGIPLKSGEYEMQLKYVTPGLKAGILLSIAGSISFVFIVKLIDFSKIKKRSA